MAHETAHPLRPAPTAEAFNLASHAVGAALAAVGMVVLLARARSETAAFAFAVYGASLVTLFLASSIHHAGSRSARHARSQRFDHVAIYLLIAGSYTPPCLLVLPREVGLPVLAVVWTAALLGIAAKVALPLRTRWWSAAPYIALGWAAVPVAGDVLAAVPPGGVALLAGGGVLYTLGAVVYATDRPHLLPGRIDAHGVWHLFVLAAAGLHFAFMAAYVPVA